MKRSLPSSAKKTASLQPSAENAQNGPARAFRTGGSVFDAYVSERICAPSHTRRIMRRPRRILHACADTHMRRARCDTQGIPCPRALRCRVSMAASYSRSFRPDMPWPDAVWPYFSRRISTGFLREMRKAGKTVARAAAPKHRRIRYSAGSKPIEKSEQR